MKKSRQNFLIDILAFTCFVFLTTTGVLMYYILPPGSGHSKAIWSLNRHGWGDVHFWIAVVFLGILALHLIKHWRWIVFVVKGKKAESSGYRAGLGLVGLFALLAIAIAPLLSPIQTIEGDHKDANHQEHAATDIRGSMNLAEIEQLSGVPADFILQQLKLPLNISKTEKLKDLKGIYGFEMEEVREIVKNYPPERE